MPLISGHCLCGAVRFSLATEPITARICWCRDCQHSSANGTVNILFSSDGLTVTGPLAEYAKTVDSGNEMRRQFCLSCGTHLFAKSSARPLYTVVRAGNIDDPSSIRTNMNIWTASSPTWACLDPTLERVEHQPVFRLTT